MYVKENSYALIACILNNYTPEVALRKMNIQLEQVKVSITKKAWRKTVADTGLAMFNEHEQGKTVKQLAAKYGLSIPTVKYRMQIMRKKVMN